MQLKYQPMAQSALGNAHVLQPKHVKDCAHDADATTNDRAQFFTQTVQGQPVYMASLHQLCLELK